MQGKKRPLTPAAEANNNNKYSGPSASKSTGERLREDPLRITVCSLWGTPMCLAEPV